MIVTYTAAYGPHSCCVPTPSDHATPSSDVLCPTSSDHPRIRSRPGLCELDGVTLRELEQVGPLAEHRLPGDVGSARSEKKEKPSAPRVFLNTRTERTTGSGGRFRESCVRMWKGEGNRAEG